YGITDENDTTALAWELAFNHVPGFKTVPEVHTKKGRKKEWHGGKLRELYDIVQSVKEQHKFNDRQALKFVSNNSQYAEFWGPPKTLRDQARGRLCGYERGLWVQGLGRSAGTGCLWARATTASLLRSENDRELDLAALDVKNRVRNVTLPETNLAFLIFRYFFSIAYQGEKYFWIECCSRALPYEIPQTLQIRNKLRRRV